MRAEFRVFNVDPINIGNPSTASWQDDIEEAIVVEYNIDSEKTSGVNYYSIEGRIATFSVLGNNVVENMLINRNSYIHPLSPEITRIAVKLIDDDDNELFFGILGFQYNLDGYSNIIRSLKAYDVIYIMTKYYMPYQDKLIVLSRTSYSVRVLYSYLLGFSSDYLGAKRMFNTFIPQTNLSFFYDITETGVFGQPVTNLFLFSVSDIYAKEDGDGTYSPNDEIFLDLPNFYANRIISYGKDSIGGVNYLTFLYYFAESSLYDDPAGGSYTIEEETLKLRRYRINTGGSLTLVEDRNISNTSIASPSLYDTYFNGRYTRQQDNSINILDDNYTINDYDSDAGYPDWNVFFTGTIAQDELFFKSPNNEEIPTSIEVGAKTTLSALLLLNNLYIAPALPYYTVWNFGLTLRNKLTNEMTEPTIFLDESNCRTEYIQGYNSTFDENIFDIFTTSESLLTAIRENFTGLFYKYKVRRSFIFPKQLINDHIIPGAVLSFNGVRYVIYELDRNYNNTFYKAVCYGEE